MNTNIHMDMDKHESKGSLGSKQQGLVMAKSSSWRNTKNQTMEQWEEGGGDAEKGRAKRTKRLAIRTITSG